MTTNFTEGENKVRKYLTSVSKTLKSDSYSKLKKTRSLLQDKAKSSLGKHSKGEPS
jgi:hypothetical protein